MDKTVYAGSIIIAIFLICGSMLFPSSVVMWLASTSAFMNVARLVLIVVMIGLMVTNPPRSRLFRSVLGAVGMGFAVAAIGRVFSGSVQLIDAILFLQAAVSFGLAAIEAEPLPTAIADSNELIEDKSAWPILAIMPVPFVLRQMIVATFAAKVLHGKQRLGARVSMTNVVPRFSRPEPTGASP